MDSSDHPKSARFEDRSLQHSQPSQAFRRVSYTNTGQPIWCNVFVGDLAQFKMVWFKTIDWWLQYHQIWSAGLAKGGETAIYHSSKRMARQRTNLNFDLNIENSWLEITLKNRSTSWNNLSISQYKKLSHSVCRSFVNTIINQSINQSVHQSTNQ